MATKFTINQKEANAQLSNLLELCAVPMIHHKETPINWDVCGMGCCFRNGLPAAMTFVTTQDISRTALTKIFGKAAMVRGVKKI